MRQRLIDLSFKNDLFGVFYRPLLHDIIFMSKLTWFEQHSFQIIHLNTTKILVFNHIMATKNHSNTDKRSHIPFDEVTDFLDRAQPAR